MTHFAHHEYIRALSASTLICFTCQILDAGLGEATNWAGLHRDPNKQLSHAQFKEQFYHILDGPKIEEVAVQSRSQCLLQCLNNDRCFSTNIGAFRLLDGNISCHLLPADKYRASEKFKTNHTFHHYSIRVTTLYTCIYMQFPSDILCSEIMVCTCLKFLPYRL